MGNRSRRLLGAERKKGARAPAHCCRGQSHASERPWRVTQVSLVERHKRLLPQSLPPLDKQRLVKGDTGHSTGSTERLRISRLSYVIRGRRPAEVPHHPGCKDLFAGVAMPWLLERNAAASSDSPRGRERPERSAAQLAARLKPAASLGRWDPGNHCSSWTSVRPIRHTENCSEFHSLVTTFRCCLWRPGRSAVGAQRRTRSPWADERTPTRTQSITGRLQRLEWDDVLLDDDSAAYLPVKRSYGRCQRDARCRQRSLWTAHRAAGPASRASTSATDRRTGMPWENEVSVSSSSGSPPIGPASAGWTLRRTMRRVPACMCRDSTALTSGTATPMSLAMLRSLVCRSATALSSTGVTHHAPTCAVANPQV